MIIKYIVPFLAFVGLVLAGIFVIPKWMAANSPTVVSSSNIKDVQSKLSQQLSRIVQDIGTIQDVERARKAKVRVDEVRNILRAMKFGDVDRDSVVEMADALESVLAPVNNYQCHVEGVTDVLSPPLQELHAQVERLRAGAD